MMLFLSLSPERKRGVEHMDVRNKSRHPDQINQAKQKKISKVAKLKTMTLKVLLRLIEGKDQIK